MVLMSTWLALLLAGVAGLGLGLGVVVGAAIVRALRRLEHEGDDDGGRHRAHPEEDDHGSGT